MIDSHAWHALTHTEQAFYMAMRRHLGGSNNGNIEATAGTMSHFGFQSKATIAKSLRSLLTVGLIVKTRQGVMAHAGKTCSLYRFTDEHSSEFPKLGIKASKPTDDWKAWKTRAEAAAAVLSAHEAAKNPDHRNARKQRDMTSVKNEVKVRAVNLIGSPGEPTGPFVGSRREPCEAPLVHLVNHEATPSIDRKPSPVLIPENLTAKNEPASHGSNNEPHCIAASPYSAATATVGPNSLVRGLLLKNAQQGQMVNNLN